MDAKKFYSDVDEYREAMENLYSKVERQAVLVSDPDFDEVNWSQVLWEIQRAINALTVMGQIHKFERLTRERLERILSRNDDEPGGDKAFIEYTHIVSAYDTWRGLELKYGVAWEGIVAYNNIMSDELLSQSTIKIPLPAARLRASGVDVLTFGDQTGELILGQDLTEDLVDDEGGDLKVLTPRETFAQAMQTLATTEKGELPFYEDFGLRTKQNENLDADSTAAAFTLEVLDSYSADPRVKEVQIAQISRDKTTINADIEIVPISGETITVRKRT